MKFSKLLIIIILINLFLIPSFIYADLPLVPCGGLNQPSCQFCHIFVMLDRIIDFVLFNIVFPVAVLLIVIGGIKYIFSSGNPGTIKQANSILFSTTVGLIIIFSSWLIISEFMTTIGVSDWVGIGDGWYRIDCPI